MIQSNKSFREYYSTGQYKGFYKLRERQYKLSGKVHITFTNGEKEIFAVGIFKEAALKSAFSQIDKFLDGSGSDLSQSSQQLSSLLPLFFLIFVPF
ncbi:MAG: hypothetical protein ACQEST_00095 [Bacteroidota bacterium]